VAKDIVKQHTRRLLKLADILEKLPDDNFDMGQWGEHEGRHKPKQDNYCGTVACVLGWASLDPGLRRQGLKGLWTHSRYYDNTISSSLSVEFDGLRDADAGKEFFGLSDEEKIQLFFDDKTREEAIEMLRELAVNREELANDD
jgi:hypothetical protein